MWPACIKNPTGYVLTLPGPVQPIVFTELPEHEPHSPEHQRVAVCVPPPHSALHPLQLHEDHVLQVPEPTQYIEKTLLPEHEPHEPRQFRVCRVVPPHVGQVDQDPQFVHDLGFPALHEE